MTVAGCVRLTSALDWLVPWIMAFNIMPIISSIMTCINYSPLVLGSYINPSSPFPSITPLLFSVFHHFALLLASYINPSSPLHGARSKVCLIFLFYSCPIMPYTWFMPLNVFCLMSFFHFVPLFISILLLIIFSLTHSNHLFNLVNSLFKSFTLTSILH